MLIHGSAESEKRTLTVVGTAVLLCLGLVGLLVVLNPFAGRPPDLISVAIDTGYVGQGVGTGTPIVMHGVTVGRVTAVSSLSGGGVRLDADLEKAPVSGLTEALGIDFRPVNYFGVSGINLTPGSGGQPLRDGTRISTAPKGNSTLQALLSQLGQVSTGVLTPRLIEVIDRATRYTDALDPLIETAFIATNAVAQVQTVSTMQLLTNATGLSVVFPPPSMPWWTRASTRCTTTRISTITAARMQPPMTGNTATSRPCRWRPKGFSTMWASWSRSMPAICSTRSTRSRR